MLTRLSAAITVGTIAFGDESATIVPNATPGPGESVVELQVDTTAGGVFNCIAVWYELPLALPPALPSRSPA